MLTLRGKTPVRFEFSDGIQETTVTIQPDEESESLRVKLQRVLDLEQGQGLPIRQPGAALAAAMAQPQFTPADRAAEEARLAGATAMGWGEDTDPDNLPEAAG